MDAAEKEDRLRGYPYYAESAVERLILRSRSEHLGPVTEDDQKKIDAQVEATIVAMAKAMTEGQLAFVRALILHAEKEEQKRIAGVLLGMKPSARQKWIEEHST